jgi:hypothetical protein
MGEPGAPTNDTRRKPNHASVTDTACTCGYLQRESNEPKSGIVFDEVVNEYHITIGGKHSGHLLIYHCPWCGGAAPQSKRASLFAVITQDESSRLLGLAAGFKTVAQAVKKLGKPDDDMAVGVSRGSRPSESEAPTLTSYRTLWYRRLSKTADVLLTDYGPEHGLRVTLQGKHLGRPSPPPPKRRAKPAKAKRRS